MKFSFLPICLSLVATIAIAPTAMAQQIWVTMDQVRSYSIDESASSVIVGNPGIADISVRDDKSFLLFGKAPGLTNIIIMNDAGKTVKNLQVRVNPPSNQMLVYHRGPNRTTYNCTTHCEVTLTVGDNQTSFSAVNSQVLTKLGQSANGQEAPDLQSANQQPQF